MNFNLVGEILLSFEKDNYLVTYQQMVKLHSFLLTYPSGCGFGYLVASEYEKGCFIHITFYQMR